MSVDLREFLAARLDEDEAAAQAAIVKYENGDRWQVGPATRREDYEFVSITTPPPTVVQIAGEGFNATGGIHGQRFAEHIARWDPARVLAEIKAKRRILARHRDYDFPANEDDGPGDYAWTPSCEGCHETWPCAPLRDLAAPYADHPDYDPAWSVDG